MPKRKKFDNAPKRESKARANQTGEGRRKPLTVTIPEQLAERARDHAYWEPGATVSGLVEEGLRQVLEERGEVDPRPEGKRLQTGPQ